MVFGEWTGAVDGTHTLDPSEKHAGNSSYKVTFGAGTNYATLTHNTFSATGFQVTLWTKASIVGGSATFNVASGVQHPSYGIQQCSTAIYGNGESVWEKWRITFWYDATANVKWARREKWTAGAWVQQGSDTSMGSGAPAAGSIVLYSDWYASPVTSQNCWYDEIDIHEVL